MSFSFAQRDEISTLLTNYVSAVYKDPILRRLLRYNPNEALAQWGLTHEATPNSLPVNSYKMTAEISVEMLFGPGRMNTQVSLDNLPIEVRLVCYGLKPMALIHGRYQDCLKVLMNATSLGLVALLSPYEFLPISDQAAGNYVNLATQLSPATPQSKGWRGVLIARDWRQVTLGWLSILFGWHDFLGRLLGYPECCSSSYLSNWKLACEHYSGEIGAVLLDDEKERVSPSKYSITLQHYTLNIFARYFGFHIMEHFPCRFNCTKSIRLGLDLSLAMSKLEHTNYENIKTAMSAPLLYASELGTFLFYKAEWDETKQTIKYSPKDVLISNRSSLLTPIILSHCKIKISSDGLWISDKHVEGRLLLSRSNQFII